MKKTALLLMAALFGILLLSGCDEKKPGITVEEKPTVEEISGANDAPVSVMEAEENYLWLAYWNYEGFNEELACFEGTDRALSVFGVLFDEDGDKPFLPPETLELLHNVKKVRKAEDKIYLSFINDLRLLDGSYSNKDVALLKRLLTEEESRELHASDILEIALQSGVDGIEIDYENIKKDESLWEPFALFLEVLKEKCDENNLKLRVVLGAYDVNKTSFPAGIEYTVMCYNLYGTHSGPGPKADVAFLKETFKRCENLPGGVSAAFATGGFVWADGKYEKAVTEKEAKELYVLAGEQAGEPLRDEGSGALYFTYEEDGVKKEVWYADGETLKLWKSVAGEYGIFKFSLWKVGGNSQRSLSLFAGK
ncbi:MAG: glycosyl hydrolase [Lachnospiraceae bacterium]|nr:glycosyl hydrolase [Lachnospiraceae bacterium]